MENNQKIGRMLATLIVSIIVIKWGLRRILHG